MKTKTIMKSLALAMLMPAMLLTTACSSDDDAIINNNETPAKKGYTLPVTINVTRQGDAATRATYTDNGNGTGSLAFSTGDKLFVTGAWEDDDDNYYCYAGMLDYVSDGTFSGTIMTETEWTGTIEGLLGGASARLLPAGYEEYGYLSIAEEGTYDAYLSENSNKAFATSKAAAVEQFSYELDNNYSSGFELIPANAILNFTINGLDASTEVDVVFSRSSWPEDIVVSGKVTTDGDGTATFAIGMKYGNNLKDCTLTVGGNAIALPDKTVAAGKIYNISRSMKVIWNSSKVAGINISEDPEENSFESDGITVAAFGDSGANFTGSKMSVGGLDGYFTFTSSVNNIKKIEINYTGDVYGYEEETPVGWSLGVGTFTWEGDPATSVTLPSTGYSSIEGITSIVFTLE